MFKDNNVVLLFDDAFYLHKPPYGYHPENPYRLDMIFKGLREHNILETVELVRGLEPLPNARDTLISVHDADYVELVYRWCRAGGGYIDPDTYVVRESCEAAERAVTAAVRASQVALLRGEVLAFAIIRPPGHHAGVTGRAMGAPTQGFCLFNNIAAAVKEALKQGVTPILIIDIDVHHGNGTQEIFWNEPRVFHVDLHEDGIYPGTGDPDAAGGPEAFGTKVNIPLEALSGDDDYVYVLKEILLPLIHYVRPKLLALSAGFDAYRGDGLADMNLTERFYGAFGSALRQVSRELGVGVVAVLEGGYSVGLLKGLPAMVEGFMNPHPEGVEGLMSSSRPSSSTKRMVERVKRVLRSAIAPL